jgi:hypothetical protein
MISIIICARKKDISPELRSNIETTIGDTACEIIVIDNSNNDFTIFSAYNRGVTLSQYPVLLFMHDDILFKTPGWGAKIANHFKDEQIGAIGVAGTPYLSFMPGGWWSTGMGYLHLLQSDGVGQPGVMQEYAPGGVDPSCREVVALDGVWFCIRKSLFSEIRFDETTYDGFHFYDLDTTLQVYRLGYTLLSIDDILIHHLSQGILDEKWIRYAMLFRRKWQSMLPIACVSVGIRRSCLIEYRVLHTFIGDKLRVRQRTGQKESQVYLFGLKELLAFPKSYLYFKTPFWAGKLFFKYIGTRLAGR